MSDINIPSASDAAGAAGGLLGKGKELVGRVTPAAKKAGAAVGTALALDKLHDRLTDAEATARDKVGGLLAFASSRLKATPLGILRPREDDQPAPGEETPAEDAPPNAAFVIPQYKDP